MERARFLHHLAVDHARLRALAAEHPTAPVPSCPGWTMSDLVDHVAEVYQHKVEWMRIGRRPDEGASTLPPGAPVERLDFAYQALTGQFAAHGDDTPTSTWYERDQTVGFWVRRMTQETVIHRVDAEQAAGVPVAHVSDDLALDGIDEVLTVFLAYQCGRWPGEFAGSLPDRERVLRVDAGRRSWLVRLSGSGVVVADGPDPAVAATVVAGAPPTCCSGCGAGSVTIGSGPRGSRAT